MTLFLHSIVSVFNLSIARQRQVFGSDYCTAISNDGRMRADLQYIFRSSTTKPVVEWIEYFSWTMPSSRAHFYSSTRFVSSPMTNVQLTRNSHIAPPSSLAPFAALPVRTGCSRFALKRYPTYAPHPSALSEQTCVLWPRFRWRPRWICRAPTIKLWLWS